MQCQTMGPGANNAQPDVCMTPPFGIPAPFPNIALNTMCIPTYFTIMILGQPQLNLGAQCAMSNGDEGGTLGGVTCGMIMGMCRALLGSTCEFIAGMPCWRATAPTLQNLSNCPGTSSVPSQSIKTIMR